jgi:hypothetical protein
LSEPLPVQKPLPPPWDRGQLMVPQSPAEHETSHAHEFGHATLPHALVVEHVTSHAPVPHVMLPHAPGSLQCTEHELAAVQSTLPHGPPESQWIEQSKPDGQVALPVGLLMVHPGGFDVVSHDEHCDGQPPTSTQ